jgi:AraC-like DNA-binding protein
MDIMSRSHTPPEVPWWPDRLLRCHPLRRIFVCGRQLHPPLYGHVVNFPRLELPLRGYYENQIEQHGRVITVKLWPGTALFAPPNCWNLPVWKPGLELMSLLFGVKQIGVSIVTAHRRVGPQLAAKKFSVPRPLTGPVPSLLEAMTQLTASNDLAVLPDLARGLLHCVRQLFTQPSEPAATSRAHALLESICVYLQNHYQYDITRDSVSKQFGITPNHLSRLFQTHGHMTFSSYLTHVRIDRAKHLLRNYNLKLEEIAARCGYYDAPYFCHVFKRLTKMTPAEYRLKAR